jgi:hypothetical protein
MKYPEFALIVTEGPTDPFVADCCLTLEVKLVASHAWPLTVKNCKFPVVNLRPDLSSVWMSTFGVTPWTFRPTRAFCECWGDPERKPQP